MFRYIPNLNIFHGEFLSIGLLFTELVYTAEVLTERIPYLELLMVVLKLWRLSWQHCCRHLDLEYIDPI